MSKTSLPDINPFEAKRAGSSSSVAQENLGLDPDVIPVNPGDFIVPQNPQACLDRLPEELLSIIFGQLDNDKSLATLCLTNKRCRRIANAFLYERILGVQCGKILSVANSAELATNVREMDLCNHPIWHGVYDGTIPLGLDEELRNEFERAVRRAVNLRRLKISEKLPRLSEGQVLVQKLGWLELFNNVTTSQLGSASNPFTHLNHLYVVEPDISIHSIRSVFRVASLTHLHLVNIYQTSDTEDWSFLDSSCNIEVLELESCFLDSSTIAQIVRCIKALKVLNYTQAPFTNRGGEPSYIP